MKNSVNVAGACRAASQPSLVRFRPNLAEVARRYTRLRQAGARFFVGRCPLHEDSRPSFVCCPDGRFWFGLQWGDRVDLVSHKEGVLIFQAAARLTQSLGKVIARRLLRQGETTPWPRPASAQARAASSGARCQ